MSLVLALFKCPLYFTLLYGLSATRRASCFLPLQLFPRLYSGGSSQTWINFRKKAILTMSETNSGTDVDSDVELLNPQCKINPVK